MKNSDAQSMTTRDISEHLASVYGVDASAEMISRMTGRILPVAMEWQNRPLERKYAIVFMDAVHFHVRQDNQTVKKAVYVAIGTRLNGQREVLGMWIGGKESTKYWLRVLNEIKNRGVENIMIVSVDGSYIHCLVAQQLGAAFHLLQVSGREQKTDLYNEFHRELQPAAQESDQEPCDILDR